MTEATETDDTGATYSPRPIKWIDDRRRLHAVTDVDAIVYDDGDPAARVTIIRDRLLDVDLTGPAAWVDVPVARAKREAATEIAYWLSDPSGATILLCDDEWWTERYYAARDAERRGE